MRSWTNIELNLIKVKMNDETMMKLEVQIPRSNVEGVPPPWTSHANRVGSHISYLTRSTLNTSKAKVVLHQKS